MQPIESEHMIRLGDVSQMTVAYWFDYLLDIWLKSLLVAHFEFPNNVTNMVVSSWAYLETQIDHEQRRTWSKMQNNLHNNIQNTSDLSFQRETCFHTC